MLEKLKLPSLLQFVSLDNIRRVRYLGEGSFGEVWLVEDIRDGKQYAMKYFLKFEFEAKQNKIFELEREIVHLFAVSGCSYICGIGGIGENDRYLYILQEYCGQSLKNAMKTATIEQKLLWFNQICIAIQFCHCIGLVHLDIKPENIVVSDVARLIDFGISQYVQHIDNTVVGTLDYLAPETGDDEPYIGKETDIWALGVSLYEMLYGILPFEEPGKRSMTLYLKNLEEGKWNKVPVEARFLPLFEGMFHLDVKKRWNIKKILEFINSI